MFKGLKHCSCYLVFAIFVFSDLFTSLLFNFFFFFFLASDNGAHEDSEDIDIDIPEFQSPEQIDELATLSLASQSHWMNLLDLDVIKVNSSFSLKK